MDIDALRLVLQEGNSASLSAGFVAGFLFAFNPMVFATVPVVLAYVTKAREPRSALFLATAFMAGMLTAHAVLGVSAALGGAWASRSMGHAWGLVLGPVLIFLGLLWPGWLKVRIPWFPARGRRVTGALGAFLLGVPFTVALCPACTPALLATITASAAIGSVSFGLALLLAFGLGRSVPVLVGALGVGWLQSLEPLTRHHKAVEVVGGVTLVLSGLYFLYASILIN